MQLQSFSVKGVTCNSCVKKISEFLNEIESIEDVKVSRAPNRVSFKSNEVTSPNDLNTLFRSSNINKYSFSEVDDRVEVPEKQVEGSELSRLFPLALVISYLAGTVLLIGYMTSDFSLSSLMSYYMGGFFIIFSFFKFLNLEGFVDAFTTYDPISKSWRPYGYFYATFELIAGIGYLVAPQSLLLNLTVLVLLSISSAGVIQAVMKKTQIQCACLGTIFNLPMTKVTIVENISMIVMAIAMIV